MKQNSLYNIIIQILSKITLVLIVVLILHTSFFSNNEDTKLKPVTEIESHDTLYLEGTGAVSTPVHMKLRDGVTYVFTDTIPEDITDGYAMMMYSLYSETRVYVDDELIGEYGLKKHLPMGHMVGNIRVIVPLDESMAGKTVTIKLMPFYKSNADYSAPVYGHTDSLWRLILKDNLVRFSVLIMLVTLIVIVLGLMIYQRAMSSNIDFYALFYLEGLLVLAETWIVCSSDIPQFFTSCNETVCLVSFVSLSMLGIPFVGFCERIMPNGKNVFRILRLAGWWLPILNIMCYLSSVCDPMTLLPLTHIYYVVIAVTALVYSIRGAKRSKESSLMCLAIILLAAFAAVGMFFYYAYPSKGYDAVAFGVGVLVFAYVLFAITIRRVVKVVEEEKDLDTYKVLAFEDKLTGLENRSSFERFFGTLDEQRLDDKTITMFMFDLNYLKITNDKYGHKAGDQLLYGLALCIRETLGKYGRTYRLGGDEFAAIVVGHADRIHEILEKFNSGLEAYNKRNEYPISTAVGYATAKYTKGDADFYNRLFREADDMMYANKQLCHQKNGTECRGNEGRS